MDTPAGRRKIGSPEVPRAGRENDDGRGKWGRGISLRGFEHKVTKLTKGLGWDSGFLRDSRKCGLHPVFRTPALTLRATIESFGG